MLSKSTVPVLAAAQMNTWPLNNCILFDFIFYFWIVEGHFVKRHL